MILKKQKIKKTRQRFSNTLVPFMLLISVLSSKSKILAMLQCTSGHQIKSRFCSLVKSHYVVRNNFQL